MDWWICNSRCETGSLRGEAWAAGLYSTLSQFLILMWPSALRRTLAGIVPRALRRTLAAIVPRALRRALAATVPRVLHMALTWPVRRDRSLFAVLAPVVHLILILALILPAEARAERQAQVVEPCNIAFYLPDGFSILEQTRTSLLARNGAGMELAVFCAFNESRTYDPGRILAKPGVKEIKQLHMEGEIRGLLYSNTRFSAGKKLESLEAYIATRNLEYRVIAIPSGGTFDANSKSDARDFVEELLAGLSWIAPPDPTISEEQYRLRLWIASGAGMVFLALLGLYFWKRKKG